MKYLLQLLPLLLLPILNGCTSFQAAGVVATTVDGAMNGWGDYVRAGKAKPSEEKEVKAAYEKYQACVKTVEAVIKSQESNPIPGQLDAALAGLQASKNDLITLIYLFNPKK